MKTKTTITEKGYIVEFEGSAQDYEVQEIATYAKALELQLSELPSRRTAKGKPSGAIVACQASDDEAMLTYVAQQDQPRARRYLEENCPLNARDARSSLTRLIKKGELELRPSTYLNAAGKERPMQGVFFTEDPKPEENGKTSFLG